MSSNQANPAPVDVGRRTLPLHNEETAVHYTSLKSVAKRGDLVVVTENNLCWGFDRRELISYSYKHPEVFRPDGKVLNLHTNAVLSEEASRSLVHQVFGKFRDGIN